ncbi:MAG: GNAT family N-acetyltransferase [Planctomycetes bacterium]|nr:GNAT family N-acetyltransferase [Planctomycetota bacterium]
MRPELDPIVFRYEARDGDLDAVRSIVASTGFFRPDEIAVAVELVGERLAKGDASGYHFVFAESAGAVLGYACYGPIACTVGSYDLYWIAVDAAAQGRGLGRRLLAESERLIRGRGGRRIYIETSGRPQYAPTRAFYDCCGYKTAAILEDFYDADDDKVILAKSLIDSVSHSVRAGRE